MTQGSVLKIRVPRQYIRQFSLFCATESAAQQWCESLPMGDVAGLAQQLVAAVDEFNHVLLPPQPRYAILEILRPTLQQSLLLLTARFSNQTSVLSPTQQKLADLVNRLAGLTSTAYVLVATHAVKGSDSDPVSAPVTLVAGALQRGQYFLGYKMIHAQQLHQPLDAGDWSSLHQLYALAERQQLTELPVVGACEATTTIAATYLKPLLVFCCRPNQLRREDVVAICAALDGWIRSVTIKPATTGAGLFAVNLAGDRPPVYRSTVVQSALADHRIIDTAALAGQLESLLRAARQARLPSVVIGKSIRLPLPLLEHVLQSLGSERLRSVERRATRQSVEVAPGFRNSHFHLAGQRTFEELLQDNREIAGVRMPVSGNLFLVDPDVDDAWSMTVARDFDHTTPAVAEPAGEGLVEFSYGGPVESPGTIEEFPIQVVTAIDASSRGYCLEWGAEFPESIGSGHILAIRAAGARDWRLAAIRWITPRGHQNTMAGIEVLSSCAIPWGASVRRNTSEKPVPVRVFLLPATARPERGETLITPRSGFTEGQPVLLVREGESRVVNLLKQVAMGAAFSQFELVAESSQRSDTAFMQNTYTDIDFHPG